MGHGGEEFLAVKSRRFKEQPLAYPYEKERLRTAILTVLALVAFAANSVLCRLALGGATIDAASFTTIRILSGAVTLLAFSRLGRRPVAVDRGSWLSAAALCLYAAAFSLAYLSLAAGTGALILFGAVQATMILAGLASGERPGVAEWSGLFLAVAGLVYLVLPGLAVPSPFGGVLMAIAGVSWGAYSLRGRATVNPVAVTCDNFVRAVPLALALSLAMLPHMSISPRGALLATLSGSLASGVGYVLWYTVVRRMATSLAATVQLAVPVLAATGGVIFLGERISLRFCLAALAILGGVALAVFGRARPVSRDPGKPR
ncbi:MAG TPA: DMT family transporter [Geobacteraceae bacterium]